MDSLDSASLDDGSSTVNLGGDLGPLGDAASPSTQASWNQAMADAGLDTGSGDDTGWGKASLTVYADSAVGASASDQQDSADALQPPPDAGSGGGDSPGPIASLFRTLFGHVDPNQWAAKGAAAGGAAGALVGGGVGGAGGGAAGAAGGTVVAPGVGTVAGGYAGTVAGAAEGALLGGAAGAAVGGLAGKLAGEFISYMEGTPVTEPDKNTEVQAREDRLNTFQKRIDGQKGALDESHLDAARRESNGEVVKIDPRDGEPFDHISDVQNSQNGLSRVIKDIKNRLGYPNLDQTERSALMDKLAEASRLLDHSEQFLPR